MTDQKIMIYRVIVTACVG